MPSLQLAASPTLPFPPRWAEVRPTPVLIQSVPLFPVSPHIYMRLSCHSSDVHQTPLDSLPAVLVLLTFRSHISPPAPPHLLPATLGYVPKGFVADRSSGCALAVVVPPQARGREAGAGCRPSCCGCFGQRSEAPRGPAAGPGLVHQEPLWPSQSTHTAPCKHTWLLLMPF